MSALKVLIVEDTDHVAEVERRYLLRKGQEVHHSPLVQDALDYLYEERPDVIVLDINVEGASGWVVLKVAEQLYRKQPIPVVVTTAYDDPDNLSIARLHKVDGYLVKPFKPSELYEAVMRVTNPDNDLAVLG